MGSCGQSAQILNSMKTLQRSQDREAEWLTTMAQRRPFKLLPAVTLTAPTNLPVTQEGEVGSSHLWMQKLRPRLGWGPFQEPWGRQRQEWAIPSLFISATPVTGAG